MGFWVLTSRLQITISIVPSYLLQQPKYVQNIAVATEYKMYSRYWVLEILVFPD